MRTVQIYFLIAIRSTEINSFALILYFIILSDHMVALSNLSNQAFYIVDPFNHFPLGDIDTAILFC